MIEMFPDIEKLIFHRCRLGCEKVNNKRKDSEKTDLLSIYDDIADSLMEFSMSEEFISESGIDNCMRYIFDVFDCDDFEIHVILSALIMELSSSFADVCKIMNDDENMNYFTPNIAFLSFERNLETFDMYRYFSGESKLMRFFIRRKNLEGIGLLDKVELNPRIKQIILENDIRNTNPYDDMKVFFWQEAKSGYDKEGRKDGMMENVLSNKLEGFFILNVYGEKGSGRKYQLKRFFQKRKSNVGFVKVDIKDVLAFNTLEHTADKGVEGKIFDNIREFLIYKAVPVIDISNLEEICLETGVNDQDESVSLDKSIFRRQYKKCLMGYINAIKEYFPYMMMVSIGNYMDDTLSDISVYHMGFDPLTFKESYGYWKEFTKDLVMGQDMDLEEISSLFPMTPGKIKTACKVAKEKQIMNALPSIDKNLMKEACYVALGGSKIPGARLIKLDHGWDQIILPSQQIKQLENICKQIKHRRKVYEEWDFDSIVSYGKGIPILFSGPPGTGKTMSAQVIAKEIGIDLYKIDLAAMVSKYIGDTEKNLNKVFQEASKSQVILFFDEADVLFSKRTSVKDSNDKYSNMEAAFLLQKMEEYEGITILATNLYQNFDDAFKRRLKFIVDFPLPDKDDRRKIWEKTIPEKMPVQDLDFEFLSSKFELSGSNIKNIVLHAAFLSADEELALNMKHIMEAIKNEYAKSQKVLSKQEVGEYYIYL